MFGELPKLFDRDFAIAYFLPSGAFLAVCYLIGHWFGLSPVLFTVSADTLLKDLATLGLLSLLGGIILLVANRRIVRLLEGYWLYDIGYRLNWFELKRFRDLLKEDEQSDEDKKSYEERNEKLPRHLQNKRNKIGLKKASRFPNEERLILPTSFGNIFRAFEVYPRVMYGINAIPAWYRLLAVVPKDYRTLMDSARVHVDFWVNLCFLSLLVVIEYYSVAAWTNRLSWSRLFSRGGHFPWIPVLALLFFRISYISARNATAEWGNWVKSAFDMYLPDLRSKLEFSTGAKKGDERQMWIGFNQAVLYRDAELMPEKTRKSSEQQPTTVGISCIDLQKLNSQERLLFLETALRIAAEELSTRPLSDIKS